MSVLTACGGSTPSQAEPAPVPVATVVLTAPEALATRLALATPAADPAARPRAQVSDANKARTRALREVASDRAGWDDMAGALVLADVAR